MPCSKLTIETLEKVENMFKVNNKETIVNSTFLKLFSCVSIADFEQANID